MEELLVKLLERSPELCIAGMAIYLSYKSQTHRDDKLGKWLQSLDKNQRELNKLLGELLEGQRGKKAADL